MIPLASSSARARALVDAASAATAALARCPVRDADGVRVLLARAVARPAPRSHNIVMTASHDAERAAVRHAALAFARDPARATSDVRLHVSALAACYALPAPKPRTTRAPMLRQSRIPVVNALTDFADTPSAKTYAELARALQRYGTALTKAHDALPAAILNPKARAPEPPAPMLHRCPADALEWQTMPTIGANPADVVGEYQERKARRQPHNTVMAPKAVTTQSHNTVMVPKVARPNAHRATLTLPATKANLQRLADHFNR